MTLKFLIKIMALGFILGPFFSCTKNISEISGNTMGTTYKIRFLNDSQKSLEQIKIEIDHLLVSVNKEMSTYQKDSDISFFNHHLPFGEWFLPKEDFLNVLTFNLELAQLTNGVFDPTIGPLVNLWGFGPDGKRKVPSSIDIKNAQMRVGFKNIEVDLTSKKIKPLIPKIYLDFSSRGFSLTSTAIPNDFNSETNKLNEEGMLGFFIGSPFKIAS